MSIDLSNLPSHVRIVVGARADHDLPPYAGSGNAWSIVELSGGGAADVFVETRPQTGPPPTATDRGTQEPPPLSLAKELLIIKGLRPGRATCKLVLSRSFGDRAVSATHDLTIDVVETASLSS